MPAAQFGLNIEAGATYKLRLTVRTGAGQEAPPLDLTGWQPHMQIRPSAASLDVLLDCRPENNRIVVENGPAGVLSLNIPAGYWLAPLPFLLR